MSNNTMLVICFEHGRQVTNYVSMCFCGLELSLRKEYFIRCAPNRIGAEKIYKLRGFMIKLLNHRYHKKPDEGLRRQLFGIIFEGDTPAGRVFDLILLVVIVLSVVAVMLESVVAIERKWGVYLYWAEWVFTILFTAEYLLRLIVVHRPVSYALSFFGLIDLLAILPAYLALFLVGSQSLLIIRSVRLLRVFRILKLARYLGEAEHLIRAIKASRYKVFVFVGAVLTLAMIAGTIMYLIEGERSGFSSIPKGVYWAVVTMTTVGYGDLAPTTPLGQFMATILMIMGYGIIAVPTGIVTVEMVNVQKEAISVHTCPDCTKHGHDADAKHCKFCGAHLNL